MTAIWLLETGLAWAVKPALVDPAGTVTLPGTVRLAELLDRVMANPPAGAAWLRVTVHDRLPVPDAGQARVKVVGALTIEIVEPLAVAGIEYPLPSEASGLEMTSGVELAVVVDVRVTANCATTPSPITAWFMPYTMQVAVPIP